MQIPREMVLERLRDRGDLEAVERAEQELPEKVDTERHRDLLERYGFEPGQVGDNFGARRRPSAERAPRSALRPSATPRAGGLTRRDDGYGAAMPQAPEWPGRAAVVGAGRMGGGIAEAFAVAGVDVVVADADPEQGALARERLVERVRGHVDAGLLPGDALERVERVRAAGSNAEAAAEADLVVEAVTEDLEVKRAVLGEVSAAAAPATVIASNTSSLDIDVLSGFCERPERFVGAHWFNPPEWTPAVEVIQARDSDPAHVERVREFLAAIGKAPAVVRPAVGFVANRLQMALFCEAVRCLEEGLAGVEVIDEVARSSFGFRLPFFGPFQIADMAGLDVYQAVLESHAEAYGDRFNIGDRLTRLVAAGRTGTTGGAGFYRYGEREGDELLIERDRRYAALASLLRELPPPSFTPGEEEAR